MDKPAAEELRDPNYVHMKILRGEIALTKAQAIHIAGLPADVEERLKPASPVAGVNAQEGTYACPICGSATPHAHSPEQVAEWRTSEVAANTTRTEVENLRIAIREADKRSDYGWDAANRKAGECHKAEAAAHYYKQVIEETIQRAELAESAIKEVYDVVDDAPVDSAWSHCRELRSNLRHKLLLAQSIWQPSAQPSAEKDGWIALSQVDEICCEYGPPEYVATDDGEAYYWRFAGHDLPVGDNLSDILSFAASRSIVDARDARIRAIVEPAE